MGECLRRISRCGGSEAEGIQSVAFAAFVHSKYLSPSGQDMRFDFRDPPERGSSIGSRLQSESVEGANNEDGGELRRRAGLYGPPETLSNADGQTFSFWEPGKDEFKKTLPTFSRTCAYTQDSSDATNLWTPRLGYLKYCEDEGIIPEPLLVRKRHSPKKRSRALILSDMGIGDRRLQGMASALSSCLISKRLICRMPG